MVTLYIKGEIDKKVRQEFEQDLAGNLEQILEEKQLCLKISSAGGSVIEGEAIAFLLRDLKNEGVKIKTEALDQCSSIAVSIFLEGEERLVNTNTIQFVIHLPSGGIMGTAEDVINYGTELKEIENIIVETYSIKTGTSKDVLRGIMQQDRSLSKPEILDLGFATAIKKSITAYAKEFITKKHMSILQNAVNKVKETFTAKQKTEKTAVKNIATVLQDGTIIYFDKEDKSLESEALIGVPVMVVTEGQMQPAPDGQATLFDGRIMVTQEGVVRSIDGVSEPQDMEKKEDEPVSKEMEKEVEKEKSKITMLGQKIESIENRLKELTDNNAKDMVAMAEALEAISSKEVSLHSERETTEVLEESAFDRIAKKRAEKKAQQKKQQ